MTNFPIVDDFITYCAKAVAAPSVTVSQTASRKADETFKSMTPRAKQQALEALDRAGMSFAVGTDEYRPFVRRK